MHFHFWGTSEVHGHFEDSSYEDNSSIVVFFTNAVVLFTDAAVFSDDDLDSPLVSYPYLLKCNSWNQR